ncbi:MAG: Rrf2 family transcriptional regulator [Selenomonadales bacterium]|nr:Rrf2 family transcriptional regulator [Selenomonadales bacterium]
MQFNATTDYAFRVALHLACAGDRIVSRREISESNNVTTMFLQKIMAALMEAGLVTSYRGANGGFRLARPAEEITLLDILEAMEGKVILNRCLGDYSACSRNAAPRCAVHRSLTSVQDTFCEAMSSITLAKLAQDELALHTHE